MQRDKHWVICYTYKYEGGGVSSDNQLWEGTIAEWFLDKQKSGQRYRYILTGAFPVTKDEYSKLKKKVFY